MDYKLSTAIGDTHIFDTDEVDGVSYNYKIAPIARNVKAMNYLEIEKYIDGKLVETIMVSQKQIVYQDIQTTDQWWHIFKSGNRFSLQKRYTKKEGAEWVLEKKWNDKSEIVNLQYDVKDSLIEKIINLITYEEQEN